MTLEQIHSIQAGDIIDVENMYVDLFDGITRYLILVKEAKYHRSQASEFEGVAFLTDSVVFQSHIYLTPDFSGGVPALGDGSITFPLGPPYVGLGGFTIKVLSIIRAGEKSGD